LKLLIKENRYLDEKMLISRDEKVNSLLQMMQKRNEDFGQENEENEQNEIETINEEI
jgi:hypothetical protein